MIGGIDYVFHAKMTYTDFLEKFNIYLKKTWPIPYLEIDEENGCKYIFFSKDKAMFDLMDEKGFYTKKKTGEGPFLLIFNDNYSLKESQITLVLPKEIETSKFCYKIYNYISDTIQHGISSFT